MCVPNFMAVHPVAAETFSLKNLNLMLATEEKSEDHQQSIQPIV